MNREGQIVMIREKDPNKRRDPKKRSQTFWLHEDVVEKLNQLSAASLYSKTDLINYWIEKEHKCQTEAGNLTPRWEPFPKKKTAPKGSRKHVGK